LKNLGNAPYINIDEEVEKDMEKRRIIIRAKIKKRNERLKRAEQMKK